VVVVVVVVEVDFGGRVKGFSGIGSLYPSCGLVVSKGVVWVVVAVVVVVGMVVVVVVVGIVVVVVVVGIVVVAVLGGKVRGFSGVGIS
jgi:hypothetical protein